MISSKLYKIGVSVTTNYYDGINTVAVAEFPEEWLADWSSQVKQFLETNILAKMG